MRLSNLEQCSFNPPKNPLVFLSSTQTPSGPAVLRRPRSTSRLTHRQHPAPHQSPPAAASPSGLRCKTPISWVLPTLGFTRTPSPHLHLPMQERYCPDLAEEERRQLRAFSARRRREALGQGLACPVPGPCHGCPCKKVKHPLNEHPSFPSGDPSPAWLQPLHPLCLAVRPEAEQGGPRGLSIAPRGPVLAPILLLLPLLPPAPGGPHLLPAGWEDLLRPAPR